MKKGFTLAEVLITLGIIGVVAALTLPALIFNYQKQSWVNQFKREFTVASQGFKLAMASESVENLADTELFRSINGENLNEAGQEKFAGELKKYFNIIETYEFSKFPHNRTYFYLGKKIQRSDIDINDCFSAVMNDGSFWFFKLNKQPINSTFDEETIKSLGGKMFSSVGEIFIDVNGEKGPNTFGRDAFLITVSSDGTVYPNNGISHSIWAEGTNWKNGAYYWRNSPQCDSSNPHFAGYGCAGRIVEEGWKMTY